jgi:D-alanyl-D-alanine dipeptidase
LSASLFGEGKPILVDIQAVNPKIYIDLKYATADNFTGQAIYAFTQCLVLEPVAKALSEVQKELEQLGLGLKVWDGYRPLAAQWKFWEICPDPCYVSDPRKGGRHTRGTAVDVTLVNAEGQELVMPTAFDDFSEKAHSNYTGASEEAVRNRELLRNVMEKHSFTVLPTEWWHFDFKGWQDQPVLGQ